MPLSLALPEPSTDQLAKAPLQLVVCQVRHERNLAVGDVAKALAIRDQLADYDTIEEASQHQIELVAGPSGVTPRTGSVEQHGWHLKSAGSAWTVALLPDSFALESSGYTTWTDFRTRFEALVFAVQEHLQPTAEMRLGLRYIDRIAVDGLSDPSDWHGYVNERLLGPLVDEQLGSSVHALQQVVQMLGPDGYQVLLRHGTESGDLQGSVYVLDTDCFRADTRTFEVNGLMSAAQDLHKLALQVFYAAVTPKLVTVLRGDKEDA